MSSRRHGGNTALSNPYSSNDEIIYGLVDIESSADKTWGNAIDLLDTRRPELYELLELPMNETPLVQVLEEAVVPDAITAAVSAVQVSFTTDRETTLALALDYVDQARYRNYTDLAVLPELFLFRLDEVANDVEGCTLFSQRALEAFREQCGRGNLYAVLSLVEQVDGTSYSTVCLVHPDGRVDRYRKTHLTPGEAGWASPGDQLPVFRTRFGNVGLMLGHEGVIPEVARCLTLAGADLICWPTSWLNPLEFTLLATERVLENRIIIWFGIGTLSKVVLVVMIVFLLVFYSTYEGVVNVPAELKRLVRVLGAAEWQVWTKVVLPSASPWIITGLKISVPQALVGAVVGEFIASSEGLGFLIQYHSGLFDTTGVLGGIAIMAAVVVVINSLLDRLERHLMRWRPRESASVAAEP